jgi:phage tail protein X
MDKAFAPDVSQRTPSEMRCSADQHIMTVPEQIAAQLIEREAYRVCRLLPQREFVQYCKDRKVPVDDDRLRKLERLKLFYPLLRVFRIDMPIKVEYVEGGRRYRQLGPLRDGEVWNGDTRTELARFGFSARVIRSWRENGNVWDPKVEASAHTSSIETEPRRHEAYYSQFQFAELSNLITFLTASVQTEWALEDDGTVSATWGDNLKRTLSMTATHIANSSREGNIDHELALISQFISDRYYPKTQTDERHISVSEAGLIFPKWDWYEYARNWDAPSVVALFSLDKMGLRRLHDRAANACRHIDPLADWHQLVRFISIQKRRKLRGDALGAQTLSEMAKMLRLFYRDAFDEPLDGSDDNLGTTVFRVPDIAVEDDPTRALELVANDFGINPKPQLVLFVEGATEEKAIPLIFDQMYAASLSIFGIELVNLRGNSNATGKKDASFSALWRLVDYLHHHQTVSFVLLDNEGLAARNIGAGLPRANSIHFPDRRATRADYVKLWKLSFEMDNFNDAELARALNSYSGGEAVFSARDVKECRDSARNAGKNKKLRKLDVLYSERTGRSINKPEFGRTLVKLMFDPATRRKPEHRPIVRFLGKVANTAALNHQPVTQAIWEYNQRTGHLGTLRPGAISRRKDILGQPRSRRRSK